jgi:hypothetical protein
MTTFLLDDEEVELIFNLLKEHSAKLEGSTQERFDPELAKNYRKFLERLNGGT